MADAAERPPRLAVTFAEDSTRRTFVSKQRATHPFHVCRALYRSGDPVGLCTLYTQGCSGGLFEHDRVGLEFRVQRAARAHVTSAAATIVHRMEAGGFAEQVVHLHVGENAFLEYLPEPSILFPRSRLRSRLVVRLAPGARLIATDGLLQHRLPDDPRPFDWADGETRIETLEGKLLARERYVALGARWAAAIPGVSGAYRCQGSLLVLGEGLRPLDALREALSDRPCVYAGATSLPGDCGVLARVLAEDGAALRSTLRVAWECARRALCLPAGRAAR